MAGLKIGCNVAIAIENMHKVYPSNVMTSSSNEYGSKISLTTLLVAMQPPPVAMDNSTSLVAMQWLLDDSNDDVCMTR